MSETDQKAAVVLRVWSASCAPGIAPTLSHELEPHSCDKSFGMKASTPFVESKPFSNLDNQIKFSASGELPNSASSAKTNFKGGSIKHGSHRKVPRSSGSATKSQVS